jgi:hypothetical protein
VCNKISSYADELTKTGNVVRGDHLVGESDFFIEIPRKQRGQQHGITENVVLRWKQELIKVCFFILVAGVVTLNELLNHTVGRAHQRQKISMFGKTSLRDEIT